MACNHKKQNQPVETPWGTTLGADTVETSNNGFSLDDIVHNGELIMLTLTGPNNYYDYHGHGMGLQYLLCERFAKSLGVSLRVEVCKDTADLVEKLKNGDGDLAALFLPKNVEGIDFCGAKPATGNEQWAVAKGNEALAGTLNKWFKPELLAKIKAEEQFALSARSIQRHVYSPMLDRKAGIISQYDHLFQKYAPTARWDWRLLAAQCYQESTFDPMAHSWAGARGLMQIMPATAAHLGLPASQIHEPEPNVAAATKLIRELDGKFNDITDRMERIRFILASYNGGHGHIRDAMALARKYGHNPQRWEEVAPFVLRLSTSQFYNDPVVRNGYMRGSETVDYVERIGKRWQQYSGMAPGGISGSYGSMVPQRATKKYRFHL